MNPSFQELALSYVLKGFFWTQPEDAKALVQHLHVDGHSLYRVAVDVVRNLGAARALERHDLELAAPHRLDERARGQVVALQCETLPQ